jgi:hypothetical protein
MTATRMYIRSFLSTMILIAWPALAVAEEVTFDFRGGKFDHELFRFDGHGAEAFYFPEERGLRLHYAKDNLPQGHAGIVWKCDVRGDFTATAHYEVHENSPPQAGYGVGLEFFLYLDTRRKEGQSQDGIPFVRLARPREGLVFRFSHMTYDPAGQRTARSVAQLPADPDKRRGRLQLARQGPSLVAAFAEGDDGPWTELQRLDIGTMDILMIRLGGVGTNAPLDAHILDMGLKGPQVRFWNRSEAVPRTRAWLWGAGGLVGILVVLLVAAHWRRKAGVR